MSVTVSKKWLIVVGFVVVLISAAVYVWQNDVIHDYLRASVIERFNRIHYESLVWTPRGGWEF